MFQICTAVCKPNVDPSIQRKVACVINIKAGIVGEKSIKKLTIESTFYLLNHCSPFITYCHSEDIMARDAHVIRQLFCQTDEKMRITDIFVFLC